MRRIAAAAALLLPALMALAAPGGAMAGDVYTVLGQWPELATFRRLVDHAGLAGRLRGDAPITVFAPTNAAFERLDANVLADLESPAGRERLRALVRHHLVPGRVAVFDLRRETPRPTIEGKSVRSLLMSGAMMVNDAFIEVEDIPAENGLVHTIDKVLEPGG